MYNVIQNIIINMLKSFFNGNGNTSKTGFFKVEDNKLIAINEIQGNGSINSCIETLGFSINHIHVIYVFDSKKLDCLGFKTLSKELVFVLAKSKETKLTYLDVQDDIDKIDWQFEYSSINIEDILQDAIDTESFDFNFLNSVVDLVEDSKNIYKSEQLGLFLQFENEILISFASSSWDNSATKWLANLNPLMVRKMIEEAKLYHQNEIAIMDEVNRQTEAILEIPDAIKNIFIPLHRKANGNINFYNLLISHYTKECDIDDFLFMNKGRFKKINTNTFEAGNFIYSFDVFGKLESSIGK